MSATGQPRAAGDACGKQYGDLAETYLAGVTAAKMVA